MIFLADLPVNGFPATGRSIPVTHKDTAGPCHAGSGAAVSVSDRFRFHDFVMYVPGE